MVLTVLPRESSLLLRRRWAIRFSNPTFSCLLAHTAPGPVAGFNRAVSRTNSVPNTRALPWDYLRNPCARQCFRVVWNGAGRAPAQSDKIGNNIRLSPR